MARLVRARGALISMVVVVVLPACSESTSTSTASHTVESNSSSTPDNASGPVNGGTLNIGLVQEPTSFLAAGITDSMTFSYAVDAVVNEGLLWYKSVDETANAKTQADFWRPMLATEVPSTANGDVKTSGCKDTAAKMCVTWKLRSGVKWN